MPEEVYQYLKDDLIPLIYDEVQKSNNGYANSTQSLLNRYNNTLENETVHMLGHFNYYVGMRWSFKRQKYIENTDDHSKIVLNERTDYMFKKDKVVDDYKEPIIN